MLIKLDDNTLDSAAGWLADPDNARWLDFGGDVQAVSPITLRLMNQRPVHCLRLFVADQRPIGVVALSGIGSVFRTANLWYVLGEKQYGGQGHTARAVAAILDEAFGPLELVSVSAWAVEENTPSIRVLEKNNFRRIGIQRRCHWLTNRHVDRVLFDIVPEEHGR